MIVFRSSALKRAFTGSEESSSSAMEHLFDKGALCLICYSSATTYGTSSGASPTALPFGAFKILSKVLFLSPLESLPRCPASWVPDPSTCSLGLPNCTIFICLTVLTVFYDFGSAIFIDSTYLTNCFVVPRLTRPRAPSDFAPSSVYSPSPREWLYIYKLCTRNPSAVSSTGSDLCSSYSYSWWFCMLTKY